MEIKLNNAQFEFVTSDKTNNGMVAGLGCLPFDTEYLTRNGWKKISEYNNEEILIYDKDNNSTHFSYPNDFIKKDADKFITYKTTQFEMTVSPEHRILYKTRCESRELKVSKQEDLTTKRILIPRSFSSPNNANGVNFTESQIRLMVMISADGSISANRIRLNLKRLDKKQRALSLLKKCKIDYNVICPKSCRKNGYLKLTFIPPILTKDLSFLWDASKEQLEYVADECRYWDGSIDKRNGNVTVTGTDKNSLDLIQYALTIQGKNTSINVSDKREYKSGTMFNIRQVSTSFSGLRSATITEDYTHTHKYCFNVETSFFIVRQNGNIFITGNSGKSYVATLKCIMKKIEYPKLTVAYYLPNYGLIRDIAWDKFPSMLELMGYKYKINKTDKEIHIENYGKIIFRSMDTPETIVGFEVFYSLIDECDILPIQKMTTAYNKILARNRQKAPVPNQMDIVGTPEGFKFFYNRFVKNFNKDTDLLIKTSTYNNKHLPDGYIEGLKQQYPPQLLEAYLNGEFVNLTSGTIFSYFKRDKHNSKITDDGYGNILISQDFNIGGCISCVYKEIDKKLIQIDEFESYDTKEIIANIKRRYQNRVIEIYPDASGVNRKTSASESDIDMLRNAGFRVYVNNKNPSVRDRITITNNCFDKSIVSINIDKCPRTTEAYEQHSYKENGEPDKVTGAGTVDDYTDGATYILAYKYPINKIVSKVKHNRYK